MNASRCFYIVILTSAATSSLADPPANDSLPSPDRRWIVAWSCQRTWQPDSCSITLSRQTDGKAFFTDHAKDRYIEAVWNAQSNKCLLLDAPDNASSYLWLFHVQGDNVTSEKLDYDLIGDLIEATIPAARPAAHSLTRSGIKKIVWDSARHLRLSITYNNVPVVALIDVEKPKFPRIRIVRGKEE